MPRLPIAVILFVPCMVACTGPAWQAASEGCPSLRESVNVCAEAARELETKLDAEWRAQAATLPPYGQVVLAADVDDVGALSHVAIVHDTAGADVVRLTRRLLEEAAPYPRSSRRRIFVQFTLQPAAATALMPPKGDDTRLHALVEQKQPAFRECFRTATTDNGDFAFKGTLVFTVSEMGDVRDPHLEAQAPADKDFVACVIEEASTIKLPAWQYTGRVVRYPLDFAVRIKKRGR